MIILAVLFKNVLSCEVTIVAPEKDDRYFSNHIFACKSRWFVGSSNSSISGLLSSNLLRAARINQPPLNSFMGLTKSVSLNPRPDNMDFASCSGY